MDETWTLPELVAEAASRIARMPAPKNGQVRPVPDERTFRYYAAQGLLAKPAAMRGRTALYGRRHLAQIIAIKRLQGAGRTLADIAALWPQLDDRTLETMSGVELPRAGRRSFWKAAPAPAPVTRAMASAAAAAAAAPAAALAELAIELGPHVRLSLALPEDAALSAADVRAIRAAAAPLVAELARRGLTSLTRPPVAPDPEENEP